ncbi:MAG: L-lysine 6-transaminase [Bacteroidetes bacterium]|nr:L-lysine 6-transaminase [Bacteroidota bacterium]
MTCRWRREFPLTYKLKNMNADKVFETLGRHILADGLPIVMDMECSSGSWLVDQRDGTRYLDMFTMYASASIGYNHPYILKHKELLGEIAVNKPTISDIYNVHYARFMEIFENFGIPDYLPNAFFVSGGALAVENALKTAFDWKVRKNMEKGIEGKGSQVIHFKQAFHGRSGYTLSLTNTDPVKTMYFPKFDWPRITNPKLTFPLTEASIATTVELEKQALEEINNAIESNPNDIAAILLEPIQGEGGDNHFRNEFVSALRSICDQKDIILILDEVQTGVGLTGKFWCHEHFDAKPDIICFGKKAQVCGILASNRIKEVKDNVFEKSSRINSTFGGNLVDMVRFGLVLEVMQDENLVEHSAKMGAVLKEQLKGLEARFPKLVSNVRGQGLFAAFDVPDGTFRDQLCDEMMKEKVVILGCGDQSIRFRPHLNVSEEEISIAIDKLGICLAKLGGS